MLPTLSKLILEPYTAKQEVQHLDEVYDFKHFCVDGDGALCRVLVPLNNINFNHIFLIKRSSMSNTHLVHDESHKRDVGFYCVFLMR